MSTEQHLAVSCFLNKTGEASVVWRSWLSGRGSSICNEHLIKVVEFPVNKREISEYTSTLWSSVSISRSQFDAHYVQTIRNIATYMQDADRLSMVLKSASEAVRGTMLLKLPYNRSREEGAKFEQMWKYVMFSCHLLKVAGEHPRRFYNESGERVLVPAFGSGCDYYYDDGGENSRVLLSHNLSSLLPNCSIEWILRDQERGMVEVSRAALGLECFIDKPLALSDTPTKKRVEKKAVQLTALPTNDSPDVDKPKKPEIQPEKRKVSKSTLPSTGNKKPIKQEKPDNEPAKAVKNSNPEFEKIENVPALRFFKNWIKTQTLQKRDNGDEFVEYPVDIERFLKSRNSNCPAMAYLSKLKDNGYSVVNVKHDNSDKSVIVVSEKAHV